MKFPVIRLSRPAVGPAFDLVRQASTSFLAAAGALFGLFTFYDAISGDLVIMDALRVPPPFESRGYTSEITTQRLLDEIARLNSFATSSKERKNYGDKALFDTIAQSEATIAGVDVKAIRAAIQKVVGREPTRISGEIALTTVGGKDAYTVRLRSNPPRRLLVDIAVDGEPIQVLEKTAMSLLEQLDPSIAVSVYRLQNDFPNALRMVDAALTNRDPNDDGPVRQQRSFVYAQQGRFAEAEADARVMSGFPQHAALSNLYREMGKLNESLAEADLAIQASPTAPSSYQLKGRALMQMGKRDEAIEILRKSSAMFPDFWPNHFWLGTALADKNDLDEAKLAFGRTLALAPKQAGAYFALGNIEMKRGGKEAALHNYRAAYELNRLNPLFLIALLEAEKGAGNADAADKLSTQLRSALGGDQMPDRLRRRATAALALSGDK